MLLAESKSSGEPGWNWRKLLIFPVIWWCFYRLSLMEGQADTRLNGDIAWGYQVIAMVLALGFSGLATVQDLVAIWATKSGLPYNPHSSPAEPTPGSPAEAPPAAPKEE